MGSETKERGAKRGGLLDSELIWFFNDSDGDMGRRGIPIEPDIVGSGSDNEPGDHEVDSAGRYRRTLRALEPLTREQRLILRAAHVPLMPHFRRQYEAFGDLVGVALLLVGPDKVLRWLHSAGKKGSTEARDHLAKLKADARELVANAVDEFRRNRKSQAAAEKNERHTRYLQFLESLRAA